MAGADPNGPVTPEAVTPETARHAVTRLAPDAFADGSGVTARPDGELVRVEAADGRGAYYFRPEVAAHPSHLAHTATHAGTPADPHRISFDQRLAPEHLANAWTHQISETAQQQNAARRGEPQGLVRRLLNRLGRLFGLGDRTGRPAQPQPDPQPGPRPDWSVPPRQESWPPPSWRSDASPTAQSQHRPPQHLEGTAPDPVRPHQPAPDVAPVPEVAQPTAEPPRPSERTHDEIWRDRPWHGEGRRPSLDELIPSTDAEIGRWEAEMRQEFAQLLHGQEFAGLRVSFDATDPYSLTPYRNSVVVRAQVVHPERGNVGRIVREFRRQPDGTLVVEHHTLSLSPSVHGRGFAREFNRHMQEWYRYSGVDHIRLRAASSVGGYAWAREGYDFEPGTQHRANDIMQRLRTELRGVRRDADLVARWAAGDPTVDVPALRERYGSADPDAILADLHRQRDGAQDILDRAARHPFGGRDYPTPYEISRAGWNGQHGRDASWIGKRALLGADWWAVKPISDTGPLHPRGAHPDGDDASPRPPSGRDGDTAPGRDADTAPGRDAPGRDADNSSTPPAGPSGTPGTGPARVPFDFERFFNDPRWTGEATQFEQRLGAHYFNSPQIVDAARGALGQLRDVLTALTPRGAHETPEAFAARIESAFFRGDEYARSSAGQVGDGVTLDELLQHGNLRELMTAFYNAAYFNRNDPGTLARALLDVIDNNRWAEARAAGLDVDVLRAMRRQLDESLPRAVLGRLEELVGSRTVRFARDPFGTGNVVLLSERGLQDLADVIASQASRRERTPEEQELLGLITTPGHYDGLGTPLGRFERAFIESVVGGPVHPDTALPWREGVTAHDSTSTRWARLVGRDGFPVVDGISATTTRMLTAAKVLGLAGPRVEQFLGGLMGWMLPGRDHSLFEMIRGAQIAGLGRLELEPGRSTAVDLYRSLPDLDLHTLRTEILPDGLFPHEARYLHHATDPDGFAETQHHMVRDVADRLWPQLRDGHVTDADLADWLRRNGIDPTDPTAVRELGDRLSEPHVMALTVYTRHSHYLINNAVEARMWTGGVSERAVRAVHDGKAVELVENYLRNLAGGAKALPLPLMLRPILHTGDGHLDSRSPLDDVARRWVDAVRRETDAGRLAAAHREAGRPDEAQRAREAKRQAVRDRKAAWKQLQQRLDAVLPRLFDETRWHADMVQDALSHLPAVGTPESPVIAYRGDWTTPIISVRYGASFYPHGIATSFQSVSRQLDVAVRFMSENPAGNRKVLVVYRLTGEQARDVSLFSSFAEDQECVFPPGTRARRVPDAELAELVRDSLPEEWRSGCEVIVMEEERSAP